MTTQSPCARDIVPVRIPYCKAAVIDETYDGCIQLQCPNLMVYFGTGFCAVHQHFQGVQRYQPAVSSANFQILQDLYAKGMLTPEYIDNSMPPLVGRALKFHMQSGKQSAAISASIPQMPPLEPNSEREHLNPSGGLPPLLRPPPLVTIRPGGNGNVPTGGPPGGGSAGGGGNRFSLPGGAGGPPVGGLPVGAGGPPVGAGHGPLGGAGGRNLFLLPGGAGGPLGGAGGPPDDDTKLFLSDDARTALEMTNRRNVKEEKSGNKRLFGNKTERAQPSSSVEANDPEDNLFSGAETLSILEPDKASMYRRPKGTVEELGQYFMSQAEIWALMASNLNGLAPRPVMGLTFLMFIGVDLRLVLSAPKQIYASDTMTSEEFIRTNTDAYIDMNTSLMCGGSTQWNLAPEIQQLVTTAVAQINAEKLSVAQYTKHISQAKQNAFLENLVHASQTNIYFLANLCKVDEGLKVDLTNFDFANVPQMTSLQDDLMLLKTLENLYFAFIDTSAVIAKMGEFANLLGFCRVAYGIRQREWLDAKRPAQRDAVPPPDAPAAPPEQPSLWQWTKKMVTG